MRTVRMAHNRLSTLVWALATALFFFPGVPAAGASEPFFIDCVTESLQDAIDAALPGQTILPEGTCVETVVIHKDSEIDGRGQAVIDGGGFGPVVTVDAGVTARLVDIIIENGADDHGAGILRSNRCQGSDLCGCQDPHAQAVLYVSGMPRRPPIRPRTSPRT